MSSFIRQKPGAPPVECAACGSSMIRQETHPVTGHKVKNCFCCGAGEQVVREAEVHGFDLEVVLALFGREAGKNYEILPRLNTPGHPFSALFLDPDRVEIIRAYFKKHH